MNIPALRRHSLPLFALLLLLLNAAGWVWVRHARLRAPEPNRAAAAAGANDSAAVPAPAPVPRPTHSASGAPVSRCVISDAEPVLPIPFSPSPITLQPRATASTRTEAAG